MKQQRRVINIKKEDYDEIKEFCDKNALKISEWIVLQIKKVISKYETENKQR